MTDGSELVLSVSSIRMYLRCSYAWMLAYVHKVPAAPNLDMVVGSGTHSAVEAYWKGQDPEKALAVAMSDGLASVPGLIPAAASGAVTNALAMFRLYVEKIAPTFKPTMVEQGFALRLNGVLMTGIIDVADDQGPRDLKTTATPSKVKPERHRLQMSLYSLGFAQLTGRKPRRLLLDIVARNGRWKTVEVQPDYGELADAVAIASHGIIAGEFSPTGASSGACSRCPYSTGACRFVRLD